MNVTTIDSRFYLTWPEPSTLDITGEDPDIIGYCVNITDLNSSETLLSQCGITDTEFYFDMPSDFNAGCIEYAFAVSAMNIAGAGIPSTTVYNASKGGC